MIWLMQFPPQKQPHIMMIQETHWRLNSEWTSDGWFCVSSGATDKDRSAGLLTMIRIDGVREQDIRIRSVVRGRFDHVRVDMHGASADLLNIQQKAVSFGLQ